MARGGTTLVLAQTRGWKTTWPAMTLEAEVSDEEAVATLTAVAPIDRDTAVQIANEGARSRLVLRCAAAFQCRDISSGQSSGDWSNVLTKLTSQGVVAFDVPNAEVSVTRTIQNQLTRMERADRVRLVQLSGLPETGFSVKEAQQHLSTLSATAASGFLHQLHDLFLVTLARSETAILELP